MYQLLILKHRYGGWAGSSGYHGPQFTPGTPQHVYRSPLLPNHTFQERSFRSPPPHIPTRTSPLPGSEEYIQRNIKETSERIKKQLDLDNSDAVDATERIKEEVEKTPKTAVTFNSPCLFTFKPFNIFGKESDDTDESNERPKAEVPKMISRRDSKSDTKYDVEEISKKIMAHITNLSSGKKMNLINMGSESYDEAIHRIQKNERLTIIRALRDACSDQPTEASSILNTIIPDMDIKIEQLPADKREELSSSLKVYDDEMFGSYEPTVDPDLMFQQAQEMLSGLPDDIDPVLEDVNVHQDDSYLRNMDLSPELLPKNPTGEIDHNLDRVIEPLENPAAETLKMRELLNEPVISSDMHFLKNPVEAVSQKSTSSPAETGTVTTVEKQRALEESYKQFEAAIFSSLVTYEQPISSPLETERFRNDSGRFKTNSSDESVITIASRNMDETLLPVDFNFSNSYLNLKNSGITNPIKESDKKTETKISSKGRDKQLLKIEEEQTRKHLSPNLHKDKKEDIKIKTESEETHIALAEKPKMSLDERIAKELQTSNSHKEKGSEHHRRKNEPLATSSKKTKNVALEDSTTSQSNTPPQTSNSSRDFLQPKASQKITETSEVHRKKIWRSPGEKKFMAEQKHRVSVYENSDTELDFSGPDTDDEIKNIMENSFLSNAEVDEEIKNENDPINKNKHTDSVNRVSDIESKVKVSLDVVKQLCKTPSDTHKTSSRHDAEIPHLEKANVEEKNQSAKQRSSDSTKNSDIPESETIKRSESKKSSSHQVNKQQRKRSIERDVSMSKYFLQNEANAALHSVGVKNSDASNKTNPLQDDVKKGSGSEQDTQKNNNHAAKTDYTVKEVKHDKPVSKLPNKKHDYDKKVGYLNKSTPMEAETALKTKDDGTAFDKPAKNEGTQVGSSKKDKPKTHSCASKVDTIENLKIKTEQLVEDTINAKPADSEDSTVSELTQDRHKKHHTAILEIKGPKETIDDLESKSEYAMSKVEEAVPKHTSERKRGRPRKSRFSALDTRHLDISTETSDVRNDVTNFKSSNDGVVVKSESIDVELPDSEKTRSQTTKNVDVKNEETIVKSNMGDVNLASEGAKANDLNESTPPISTPKLGAEDRKIEKLVIKAEKTDLKRNEETACVNPKLESTKISHPKKGRAKKSCSKSNSKDSEGTKDDQNKSVSVMNVDTTSDTVEVNDVRKRKLRKSHTTSKESEQNLETKCKENKEVTSNKSELEADAKPTPSNEGDMIKDNSLSELNIKDSEKTAKSLEMEEGKCSGAEEQPNIESSKVPVTETKDDFAINLQSEKTSDASASKLERIVTESVKNSEVDCLENRDIIKEDTQINTTDVEKACDVSEIKTQNAVLDMSIETEVVTGKPSRKVGKAKRGRSKKDNLKNKRAKIKTNEKAAKLNEETISVTPKNVVQNSLLGLSVKEDVECNTQETNLKTQEGLPVTKPESFQQQVHTKTSSPKKQKISADNSNIKDQEMRVTDSEVKTGETAFVEPFIVKDEELNSKRRSSRIRKSSKAETETVYNKLVEVAATCDVKKEVETPESAKRKKTRKGSKDWTEIQAAGHDVILGQNPEISIQEKVLETEENVQTQRTRSKRVLKQPESIDSVSIMDNRHFSSDSSLNETAVSANLSFTGVRNEKRNSKSKQSKKPKRRGLKPPKSDEKVSVDIKIETSITKIENTDVDSEVPSSSSFEGDISSQIITSSPQSLLRVKSLASLMAISSNNTTESFSAELKSPSQDKMELAANKPTTEKQKPKQNLRKRKLSDNEGPSTSKKQKIVTKHVYSQTDSTDTLNNDAASQSNIPCTSCEAYRQDIERKKKWIDELRKFDETIQTLLLAKAELYDKLLKGEKPSRRVARKRTAPTTYKPIMRSKCRKVPSEVASSGSREIKQDLTASLENPVRYTATRTVKFDSKFYEPCYVSLYRYSDEEFERMSLAREYHLLDEENKPYQRTPINTVTNTQPDGISNLRIVSVTSLATEAEHATTMDSLETTDNVAQTVTLNDVQLTTIFSATLPSVVLVLKVSKIDPFI